MYINKLFTIALVYLASGAYSVAISPRAVDCHINTKNLANIKNIKASCTNIIVGDLVTPGGQTLDLTGLKSGTVVTFQGTTTLGYKEWEGDLISISGSNIQINGAKGHVINGQGEKYWDIKGANGGKKKPRMMRIQNVSNSKIANLYLLNSPVFAMAINNCHSVDISNITHDNKAGNKLAPGGRDTLAHNTDAFDVAASTDIHIHHSHIYNQDDCLAVNSGSNIYFERNNCYTGHGISIAPWGSGYLSVNNVFVSDCNVYDSMYGLRVKTSIGTTGKVNNIHFSNLKLTNISKWAIGIQSDYTNAGSSGTPSDKVAISGLYLDNVTGNVGKYGARTYIMVKGASQWKWVKVNITGGNNTTKKCVGIPANSGVIC